MPPVIDKRKCGGCGLCALYCPLDVLEMHIIERCNATQPPAPCLTIPDAERVLSKWEALEATWRITRARLEAEAAAHILRYRILLYQERSTQSLLVKVERRELQAQIQLLMEQQLLL